MRTLWLLLALVCACRLPAEAQSGERRLDAGLFVNSESEKYLRVLQLAGVVRPYPWSVRQFSVLEAERVFHSEMAHPWDGFLDLHSDSTRRVVRPLPVEVQSIYNTTFPYGENDGPIWAGRGLTTAASAGLTLRWGAFTATAAPQVFWAQNLGFQLMGNGQTGRLQFGAAKNPGMIDLPQRFGTDPYYRLDPGQSSIRLDVRGVAVGVSTANEQWGPAIRFPIILGNNAPGFPHGFVGTSTPLNLGLASLYGQVLWGVMQQSEFSPVQGPDSRRFSSGIAAVLIPRGAPGLEIGGSRFFHTPWSSVGPGVHDFVRPFQGLFLSNSGVEQRTNQLASVFFRWVLQRSHVEFYGEFAREDYSHNVRDVLLEPEHESAFLLGTQKVWTLSGQRLLAVHAELVNAESPQTARVRTESEFYIHGGANQGHTQLGQLLGSPAVYGGAGQEVAVDFYHPSGRWTLSWTREQRQELFNRPIIHEPDGLDVLHTFAAEGLVRRGRWEITGGLAAGYDLNRNFVDTRTDYTTVAPGAQMPNPTGDYRDVWNLNGRAQLSWSW